MCWIVEWAVRVRAVLGQSAVRRLLSSSGAVPAALCKAFRPFSSHLPGLIDHRGECLLKKPVSPVRSKFLRSKTGIKSDTPGNTSSEFWFIKFILVAKRTWSVYLSLLLSLFGDKRSPNQRSIRVHCNRLTLKQRYVTLKCLLKIGQMKICILLQKQSRGRVSLTFLLWKCFHAIKCEPANKCHRKWRTRFGGGSRRTRSIPSGESSLGYRQLVSNRPDWNMQF